VHDELFPYAKKRILNFLSEHGESPEVKECIEQVKATVLAEENILLKNSEVGLKLQDWIRIDRKHPALKNIQGLIWETGYSIGDIKGHVYDDVLPALLKWKNQGLTLAVYSSGSIKAQHLIFQYSIKGDLRPYFSSYFDTAVGNKREQASYENIIKALKCKPADVLFLSDIKEELDAAKMVGMNTIQLVRNKDVVVGSHKSVSSFIDI
jgi:enolase-phosphatase E1